MKKNIKIIILSILIILITCLSTTVLAAMDINYYMNNNINDLTQDELQDAIDKLTIFLKDHNIGNYTDAEVRNKREEYEDRLNIVNSEMAIYYAKYPDKARALTVYELRTYYNILEQKAAANPGAQGEYSVYMQSISKIIEEKENQSELEKAVYYAKNLDESRKLSLSKLRNYKEVLLKKVQSGNQAEQIEYSTYVQNLNIVIKEKEVANELSDYTDYNPSTPYNYSKAVTITGNVLAIVRNIGIVIAIISLTIMGIRYMVGSVEEKAEYKKKLIPFTVGVVLFTAIMSVVSLIYNIVNGIL